MEELAANRESVQRQSEAVPMVWLVEELDWQGAITPEVTWALKRAIHSLEEGSATHHEEALGETVETSMESRSWVFNLEALLDKRHLALELEETLEAPSELSQLEEADDPDRSSLEVEEDLSKRHSAAIPTIEAVSL